ncbi:MULTISPECIES: amino acid ABC transporter permease [Alcaligenaceae]|uniref:amino acid ABC transporter permease n=1 Tax=Alcaligenaceae TaxID=506 RepID=UPI00291E7226|nr:MULTISPECIES: amino acid ABC transporter permease [Alcaligenaceae]MCJ9707900.1 amino acid ABC transporter permease [Bordetella hinzii]WPL82214.1 amino acid ABC transporter permease [Bordetella hinzii]BEG77724.1 Glutamate/aspartate import permease protein GltJ [Achromobacter xylosoxidans]
MDYRWNWGLLATQPYMGWLATGLLWTLLISLVAYAIALAVGITAGIALTLPSRGARRIAALYVTLLRGVPLLVQLFLLYYVVPEILPGAWGTWLKRDLPNPEYWTTAVGLGLFMSARIAEQTRAAIEATGKGLKQAALAQGMSTGQVYRHVLLPVGLRYALPPYTSELLNTVKNSSLALTIGMLELTGQSRQIESYTFHGIEAFTAATLIYMALSLLAIAAGRQIERRMALPGMLAGR